MARTRQKKAFFKRSALWCDARNSGLLNSLLKSEKRLQKDGPTATRAVAVRRGSHMGLQLQVGCTRTVLDRVPKQQALRRTASVKKRKTSSRVADESGEEDVASSVLASVWKGCDVSANPKFRAFLESACRVSSSDQLPASLKPAAVSATPPRVS